MQPMQRSVAGVGVTLLAAVVACGGGPRSPAEVQGGRGAPGRAYSELPRPDLNRWAVRTNTPLYWIDDANGDGNLDPTEVAALEFYPTSTTWVEHGAFTPAFAQAYAAIVAASKAPPPDASTAEGKREGLVARDLDAGRATLIRTDFTGLSPVEHAFVDHMRKAAVLADALYDLQTGATALAPAVRRDAASQSLFRRNRGPRCVAQATENDPACSAIPGGAQAVFDLYPAALQTDPKFCEALAARPDGAALMGHFNVVRGEGPYLTAVPYPVAYREQMTAISQELAAAAAAMQGVAAETALVTYLRAAATSFLSNDWEPADEAWAAMSVDNSSWYVRVAPDEVYWEPCSAKAGIHVTFARINQASKVWQSKLVPVQQAMEAAVAERAGAPYRARKVTFHLPDFIDIVLNAGGDREALSITAGQSLPNWGKVVADGRGRTMVMSNVGIDKDSQAARRAAAETILDAASMQAYGSTATEPGLLNTILHEATHNLGPAHEYAVGGKVDDVVFGGPIASLMEELKAQTGGLFLIEFARKRGLISDQLAAQTYVDGIVWAFGHISQGMYTGAHDRKTYSQLAAIQIGFLIDHGVLTWGASTPAANRRDTGALTLHPERLVGALDEMMKVVAGIKARGDLAGANALLAKYVDSSAVVPHELIRERYARFPRASYVYSVQM